MKKNPAFKRNQVSAFTLIEMIGVMAILTIMAGVLTPNILHSIERAAVNAEEENLHNLGNAISLYLRDNGVPPVEGNGNWNAQIAVYSSLSAADIITNKRQSLLPAASWVPRLYVIDPLATNQRALLISSMRSKVALPTIAQVKASFQTIWDTPANKVPTTAGWGGWGAGPAPALDNAEYLVIERVPLSSVYHTNLMPYSIVLNNRSAGQVSYTIVRASGPTIGPVNVAAAPAPVPPNNVQVTLPPMYLNDRLSLFSAASGVSLNYTYVVSNSPKTFDFTTANGWVPQ